MTSSMCCAESRTIIKDQSPGALSCRDYQGVWEGVEWDGEEAHFFPSNETEEESARRKLCSALNPHTLSFPFFVGFPHAQCAKLRSTDDQDRTSIPPRRSH